MAQRLEERVTMARRCAWCLRFRVKGRWIAGRRATDQAMLDATTHTICKDCVDKLRRDGLSI